VGDLRRRPISATLLALAVVALVLVLLPTIRAEALTGPTTPPGKRVRMLNPPGSEVGPGQVATWGRSTVVRTEGFGFKWSGENRSSEHIPFGWDGPDPA
jgi:hypothetical protein